jgi:hypothetical protein
VIAGYGFDGSQGEYTSVTKWTSGFRRTGLAALSAAWIGVAVAQKVQTLIVDDINGSAADGTIRFGLDGTDYEIDLNAENAQALRDALANYITAARRVGGGNRP